MTGRKARNKPSAQSRASARIARYMTQPEVMKTRDYVCGVERLNGNDAWAMFRACAAGNLPRVQRLLAKDPRLVNSQFWYQFPIHFAVRGGHAEMVRFLLDHGADSGQSTFTYDSWPKLLRIARERGYGDVEALLVGRLKRDFNYSRDFELLKEAIVSRNSRKVGAVLRNHSNLVKASDALGNNALHWSVITRQLRLIERFVDLGPKQAKAVQCFEGDGVRPPRA